MSAFAFIGRRIKIANQSVWKKMRAPESHKVAIPPPITGWERRVAGGSVSNSETRVFRPGKENEGLRGGVS
jgi:hypothetical protein